MAVTRKNKSSKLSGARDESRSEKTAEAPPQPLPEQKRPVFLIVSSVLLAAWLTFLAAMAYISTRGDSVP